MNPATQYRGTNLPRLDPGHADAPWVAEDCYPLGPRLCPCGHHEGYHAHNGACRFTKQCRCTGLPVECYTPIPGRTWKGVTG